MRLQAHRRLKVYAWRAAVCAALGMTSGCAATYSKAQYFAIGEYNPKANEAVEKEYRRLQEAPPPDAGNVKVLFETVPEGIKYEKGTVSVEKGYPVQIVGKFTLFGPSGGPWKFADYKSTGRKALCYPQVPLTWITLGIWALVMPTAYPCWARGFKTEEEWIEHLKLLTVAAKGNLVVAMRGRGGAAEGFIFAAEPQYLEAVLKPATTDRTKKSSDVAKRDHVPDV